MIFRKHLFNTNTKDIVTCVIFMSIFAVTVCFYTMYFIVQQFETTGFFTAIFPRQLEEVRANEGINEGVNEGVNSVSHLILNTIAKRGGLSAPDIVKITGKGLATVERYIARLKKEDKIEYRGSLKTGGYYLK